MRAVRRTGLVVASCLVAVLTAPTLVRGGSAAGAPSFAGGGDDVLWYAPGAAPDYLDLSNGNGTFASRNLEVGGTYRPVPGDYDRDGDTDLIWYGPGDAPDYLWWSRSGGFVTRNLRIGADYVPIPGDHDADGDTDIVWYASGDRPDYLWTSDGRGGFRTTNLRIGGSYRPIAGDHDGDGDSDIVFYAPGAAPDYLLTSNRNGTFGTTNLTIGGDYRPAAGDHDGDRDTDVVLYGPGAAPDYLLTSNRNGTFGSTNLTIGGDHQLIPGDHDRDGDTDLVLYTPGTGGDLRLSSNRNGTYSSTPLNVDGRYRPIAGDFDGSARAIRGARTPGFSDPEIRDLLLAIQPQPGTYVPNPAPGITGHGGADARIRAIAEGRGYRRRGVATGSLSGAAGQPLQPVAADAFNQMRNAASAAGHSMHVRSGFRSVDTQRGIFLRELRERGSFSNEAIAAGRADGAINDVLRLHSIPGYSRHHSGYAMDIAGPGGGNLQPGHGAEVWLRANRFANAIRFGFLPSYPPGGGAQGPVPEAWEYIYVSHTTIRCAGWYVDLADPYARWSCPDG